MTPEMRRAARESLAGLWGANFLHLRAALDQIDEYERAIMAHTKKMDSIPSWISPPQTAAEGLRFLAYWFDSLYGDAGTGEDGVQKDLRRWATQIDADEGLMLRAADILENTKTSGLAEWHAVADLVATLRARLGDPAAIPCVQDPEEAAQDAPGATNAQAPDTLPYPQCVRWKKATRLRIGATGGLAGGQSEAKP